MRFIIYQIIIQLIFQQFVFSQKKTNWQIYDQDFNKVREVSAKEISIQNQFIWYRTGKGFGVMDMQGHVLIKPKYEEIAHYPGGFTVAGGKGCFTMVYAGKEILPAQYNRNFLVDSSGYFIANEGCSENVEAYIITTPSIHDRTGKIISAGCEDDINRLFFSITKKVQNRSYSQKSLNNGFTIKLMNPRGKYLKKGIYNSNDSLVFSCVGCRISDNINGLFFIYQHDLDKRLHDEIYAIDTTGAVKIKGGYKRLSYDQRHDRYLYQRGNEYGLITKKGVEQMMFRADNVLRITPISANRFLLSIQDSTSQYGTATICDSTGRHLFAASEDYFDVAGKNCLIRKSPQGYVFVDNDGRPVSDKYDSIYAVPDFNFPIMVLGMKYSGGAVCGGIHEMSPLDWDGRRLLYMVKIPMPISGIYITERDGKKGLFNADSNTQITSEYTLIARVKNDLFAVSKNRKWFTMNDAGHLKSFKKNRYINFFENYILVGN
jgi:hypothetical protein